MSLSLEGRSSGQGRIENKDGDHMHRLDSGYYVMRSDDGSAADYDPFENIKKILEEDRAQKRRLTEDDTNAPTSEEQETVISDELIAAVQSVVEFEVGIKFSIFLDAYKEKNGDQPELTEADLIAEILEAGEYQKGDDSGFEDAVMIGASAMGEDLGLF